MSGIPDAHDRDNHHHDHHHRLTPDFLDKKGAVEVRSALFSDASSSSAEFASVVADLVWTTISSADFIGGAFLFPALFFVFRVAIARLCKYDDDDRNNSRRHITIPTTSDAPTTFSVTSSSSSSPPPATRAPRLSRVALECRDFLSVRFVSSLQSIFACFCAFAIIRACAHDVIYAKHWMTNFYVRVAAPYFLYDIWAMYRAFREEKLSSSSPSNGTGSYSSPGNGTGSYSSPSNGTGSSFSPSNGTLSDGNSNSNRSAHSSSLSDENHSPSNVIRLSSSWALGNASSSLSDEDRATPSLPLPPHRRTSSPSPPPQSHHRHLAAASFRTFLRENKLIVFHHVFVPFVLFPGVIGPWRRDRGDLIIACFFLLEASTPFVSLRAVLHRLGLATSRLYVVNGFSMLVVFGCCRILVFPFIYWIYFRSNIAGTTMPLWKVPFEIPAHCNVWCLALFSLQLHWFVKMTKGALKLLARRRGKRKSETTTTTEEKEDVKPTVDDVTKSNNNNNNDDSDNNNRNDALISEETNRSISRSIDQTLDDSSSNLPFSASTDCPYSSTFVDSISSIEAHSRPKTE